MMEHKLNVRLSTARSASPSRIACASAPIDSLRCDICNWSNTSSALLLTGRPCRLGSSSGVAHALEHMMFKGSDRRTAFQVNEDFDRIGASHNAFTSGEMTCFHAHVLPEHLPAAVEMLADILRPALRQADFDEEKGVIIEEIAMYEDDPQDLVFDLLGDAEVGGIAAEGLKKTITYFKTKV